MISKEILQAHYREYASQPDVWVENMTVTKRSIVRYVLTHTGFRPQLQNGLTRIVVMGASDKRYIPIHQAIFTDLLEQRVQVTTLDIDAEHLQGGEGVVEHDITQLFPHPPYGIVFSHELMKFLTPEEQLQAIKNSYHALTGNGLVMHIMHSPSIKGTAELRPWQYRVNPDALVAQLSREGVPAQKIVFESESSIDWLKETTVITIQK